MDCTEAYKEHIMYSFNGFCKVVIRYGATGTGGGKEKYPLNTSQKKSSIL